MKKIRRIAAGAVLVAAFVLPASAAVADDNPCKGDGTSSKCRPPCQLQVDPGDPLNGIAPTATYYCP